MICFNNYIYFLSIGLLWLIIPNHTVCQSRIGINNINPISVLDIRSFNSTMAADLMIADFNGSHYLKLISGHDGVPISNLEFEIADTFRISGINKTKEKIFLSMVPGGNIGVGRNNANEKLDVQGRLKIRDDENANPTKGVLRFNENNSTFEGHNGLDWIGLDPTEHYKLGNEDDFNNLVSSWARNSEESIGDVITIEEPGTYMIVLSGYFKSFTNYIIRNDIENPAYDVFGCLKLYLNNVEQHLIEVGKEDFDFYNYEIAGDIVLYKRISFSPGTRTFIKTLDLNAGDEIRLTAGMISYPLDDTSYYSNLGSWRAFLDGFFVKKLN